MEEIKLDVQVRKQAGTRKIRGIRREDFIPAVIYGGKQDTTSVKVERRGFEKIMRGHRGQNVIFHLNVLEEKGKAKDYAAIIKQEQHDPVSYKTIHLDFMRISLTEEITVKVAVESKGEPIGVKKDGGALEHVLWDLEVSCLPTKIPEKIVVDVSNLELGKSIHVRDIVLPEGVKTKHDPDAVAFIVVAPMKEEVAPAEGPSASEPEVIKEKKKEPEDKAADDKKAEKK